MLIGSYNIDYSNRSYQLIVKQFHTLLSYVNKNVELTALYLFPNVETYKIMDTNSNNVKEKLMFLFIHLDLVVTFQLKLMA